MSRIILFVFILSQVVLFGTSCTTTKQTAYFYNVKDTLLTRVTDDIQPRIQRNDILSISISSLNAEASAIFNTPNASSGATTTSAGSTTNVSGYLVNSDGNIQLPILGNIKAAGLTKKQLKDGITNLILDKKLLIDPIVTIRHLNFEVTVIGEVAKPTVITVPNEKISLLKALGLAGDITVYGKKDNVLLIREYDGDRTISRIDLNSPKFLTSDNYYLQPGDIVYVEANKDKVENAKSNKNVLPSVLSGLSIVAILLDRLIK
ncbi:polysaccharide biosynthesis/export family protein [Ferruginibacter sp. HRS2-29]|uniref:polysaccharide biosynthesis/export family protein n=1 Tax=Ferruginibacter sp. HRS2-29 TaxID=2487334 RepID=UPI0020CC6402|nr:polysaccharide biosynthesis/export family protein [Ferruginibacter sp. HRS2-29]MCP9751058.1 polysaccharide export protein [Ferruginibacter sp. HRS2-29]